MTAAGFTLLVIHLNDFLHFAFFTPVTHITLFADTDSGFTTYYTGLPSYFETNLVTVTDFTPLLIHFFWLPCFAFFASHTYITLGTVTESDLAADYALVLSYVPFLVQFFSDFLYQKCLRFLWFSSFSSFLFIFYHNFSSTYCHPSLTLNYTTFYHHFVYNISLIQRINALLVGLDSP